MTTQYIRYPSASGGSGSGITTYSTYASLPAIATDGAAAITLDTDTLYIFNLGSTSWKAVATPGDVLALGVIDSGTASSNGASINASSNLIMQSASATKPGLVNLTTQSFAGNKTFTGTLAASNLSGTNSGDVTLGTANGLSLSTQVLSLGVASAGVTGALSGTDWSTFNNKQTAGSYITALTGDGAASGPGSAALTLATVNSNVGSFGSSTSIPSITVNAKGLVTAASGNVVIAPAGTLSGTTLNSTVVTSSLTSVGTIGSGTWQGTALGLLYGGTGTAAASANAAFNALSPLTTKGDVLGYSTTNARLAVGGDGTFLTADSTQTTGLKWSSALTNPMTTLGDIIYGGASGAVTRLAGDTSNTRKFFRETSSGGTAAAPAWDFQRSSQTKTTNYTVAIGDDTVLFNISGASTVTLPTAASVTNQDYYIRNIGTSTAALSVATTSSQTVDGRSMSGAAQIILSPRDFIHVVSDGSNWQVIEMNESVNASYNSSTTTITTSLSPRTKVVFPTKEFDSHNAYNNSTGVYTIPTAGKYLVTASCFWSANAFTTSQECEVRLQINGTDQYQLGRVYGDGVSIQLCVSGSKVTQFSAGDTVAISAYNSFSVALAGGVENNFSIARIVN